MNAPVNRRAALGAFASVPALAVLSTGGVSATPPADPVFPAIERHRTAWAAFVETVDPLENVEGEQEGTKEEVAYTTACVAADEALEEFMATAPTTLAGLRAASEYAVEIDCGCQPDNGGIIAETLLKSPVFGAAGDGEDAMLKRLHFPEPEFPPLI